MRYDATNERFFPVTFRGMEGLFGEFRVAQDTIPEGWYMYEVRETDEGDGEPAEISERILVNFLGTIITQSPIVKWDDFSNGKHNLYIQFSDVPEWYERRDDGVITEISHNECGEENIPHYCPLESEWSVEYSKPITIKQYIAKNCDIVGFPKIDFDAPPCRERVRAVAILTYTVKVYVEGDSLDQIQDWALGSTPSTAHDDAAKNGHVVWEDYSEEVYESNFKGDPDIKL